MVQAAKSLGIDPASLRGWLKQFPRDGSPQPDSAAAVQAELHRLREENRRLTMEREILKKVAPSKAWEGGMFHDIVNRNLS